MSVNAYVSESVRIQYGGHVNVKTAPEFIAMPDIDGFLLSDASLKADFADIVQW